MAVPVAIDMSGKMPKVAPKWVSLITWKYDWCSYGGVLNEYPVTTQNKVVSYYPQTEAITVHRCQTIQN